MKRSARRASAANPLNPPEGALPDCRGQFCTVSDDEPVLVPVRTNRPPATARVAVADCTGRWGYTADRGVCFFPIQYERTLETLTTYAGICINPKRLFLDAVGRAYPLLSATNRLDDPHLYLIAHRGAAAWVLRASDGILVSRFHDVQAYFHEERALLKASQGWCYLDASGHRIWAPSSGQAGHYRNGRARFLKRRKWGYVDLAGKVIIEPRIDSAWNFSEGLAAVEWDGRWGYINEDGDVAIDGRFPTLETSHVGSDVHRQTGHSRYGTLRPVVTLNSGATSASSTGWGVGRFLLGTKAQPPSQMDSPWCSKGESAPALTCGATRYSLCYNSIWFA